MTISIPTVREVVESYDKTKSDPEIAELTEGAREHPFVRLVLALSDKNYEGADRIMAKNKWTPTSICDPDADNWHKEATLIFYACWGNYKAISGELATVLYDYLVSRDHNCVYSTPCGGNLLHAPLDAHLDYAPAITVDLLGRGINPHAKNSEGKSFVERLLQMKSVGYDDAYTQLIETIIGIASSHASSDLTSVAVAAKKKQRHK